MRTLSDLFVRNIPEIREREFKYRTKMSSHELNNLQTEAFKDILDIFNKANILQKELYEFNTANGIESLVYNKRLTETLNRLKHAEELYNNLKSADTEFRYQTKFAYEAEVIDDAYKAIIDRNTNSITANVVSSVSKVRVYNETYDETLVPDSVQVYIGPDSFKTGGDIYTIEDSDVRNIFDGTDSNVWYRKIVTSNNVESVENEIIIGLPEDIVTTRLVNEIIIKPFPVGYMDIMDIQYKTNGSWVRIPGFETNSNSRPESYTDIFGNAYTRMVMDNVGNIKLNFQALQINQIKIKMRQRNYEYDATTNRRTWYIGLRNVDVLYNRYNSNNSIFSQVFEFPETDRIIKIYDAEIVTNNPKSTGDKFAITKEYYYFDSSNNYHRISGSTPLILSGHKLLVKFFIESTEETPNIYSTRIKYKLN